MLTYSVSQRNGGYYSTGKGTPANLARIAKQYGLPPEELHAELEALKSGGKQHFSSQEINEIAKSLVNGSFVRDFLPSEATHKRKKGRQNINPYFRKFCP